MGLKQRLKKWTDEVLKEQERLQDVSRFNHRVAEKTEWSPLRRGGTNFGTHYLDQSQRNLMIFKPTKGAMIFIGIFGMIGVLGVIIPIIVFLNGDKSNWPLLLFGFVFGGLFTTASYFLNKFMAEQRVFDNFYREYYKGKIKPKELIIDEKNPLISLTDVVAFQIIKESIKSKNNRYYSYELNLIMKDASRINVIDHGKIKQMRIDADILAKQLGIPVWDNT